MEFAYDFLTPSTFGRKACVYMVGFPSEFVIVTEVRDMLVDF